MFGPRTDIERIFDKLFSSPIPSQPNSNFNFETKTLVEKPISNLLRGNENTSNADIAKEDDGTRATIPVPGVSKENITVKVKDKERVVVNAKVDEKYSDENRYTRNVRDIETSFVVPHSFEQEEIEVKHENGVLEIFIPSHDEPEEDNDYIVEF